MERLTLKADAAGALGRGELSVVYQPIVDLDTGRTTKLEALLRWRHPAPGSRPASAVFIPLAEQSGPSWSLAAGC